MTADPRAIGAHECPRCGEPYSLDGCACPPPRCACGLNLSIPVGVEQRIAQYRSDRQETLSAVADPSHKSGQTA